MNPKNTKTALFAIVLLAVPLFFLGLGSFGLFDPDEGRYATIPREMLERGDWVTPWLNGLKFFDKTPLLYWLTMISYSIFGVHDWSARLAPALAALGGLFVAYALGRRMWGRRAGLWSAVVLATSLMWPLMARLVFTDMLVSVFLFAALSFWWLGHSDENSRRQKSYFLAFWVALAFAVLSKGPVALVLAGGGIGIYCAICRQGKSLVTMNWRFGLPLFLLISVPWFVLVQLRNPEFNHHFWGQQHFARFLGTGVDRDHSHPATFYFQWLPLLFFPWTFLVPAAFATGWKKLRAKSDEKPSEKQRAAIFLLASGAWMIFFFSASDSKLQTYILPVLPLLSVAMAGFLEPLLKSQCADWTRLSKIGLALLAGILAVGGLAGLIWAPALLEKRNLPENSAQFLCVFLIFWALLIGLTTLRFRVAATLGALSLGFVAFFALLLQGIAVVAPAITVRPLVEAIRPGLTPQSELASLNFVQSFGFYAQKRVRVGGPATEIDYGRQQLSPAEQKRWFSSQPSDLRAQMSRDVPVYCILRNSRFKGEDLTDALAAMGGGAVVIVANSSHSVIGNRAAAALTPPL